MESVDGLSTAKIPDEPYLPPLFIQTSLSSEKALGSPMKSTGRSKQTRGSPSPGKKQLLPKMPASMEMFINPPSVAGVPVLEQLRKLEEEKILSRADRILVTEALQNPAKQAKITKSLYELEVGTNMPFVLKRLKALLYQNTPFNSKALGNVGEPVPPSTGPPSTSSNSARGPPSVSRNNNKLITGSPSKDSKDGTTSPRGGGGNMEGMGMMGPISEALTKTKEVVMSVVGENPVYSGSSKSPNVCLKIARRLKDFLIKYNPNTMGTRKFAVILGTGSYNPLTRMHLRNFFLAKQFLESHSEYVVLGSILSPGHPSLVRQRYRTCPLEALPPLHRLALAQMCVERSKWMSVDPWEITRRRSMDYSSLLEHTSGMLTHNFPSIDIRVFFLCKSNAVPLISPSVLKEGNFGCISVCRPQESEQLRAALSARWNGLIYIADDNAILDSSMDTVSAKKVRNKLKAGEDIGLLIGKDMADYFELHKIKGKMTGEEEWDEEEKMMPKISSKYMPPLHSSITSPQKGVRNSIDSLGDDNSIVTLLPTPRSVISADPVAPLAVDA